MDLSFLAHVYDYPKRETIGTLEYKNNLIVLPLPSSNNSVILDFLKSLVQTFPSMMEALCMSPLKKISSASRKILYLNFKIDQEKSISVDST